MPAVFGPVERLTRTSIHSAQSDGLIANETATIAAVAPSAIARFRHSRRTANHSSPTPGVTFVSSTNAHVAGHRNPTTIATAMNAWMLPIATSMNTGGSSITRPSHRPLSQRNATTIAAVHSPAKIGQGSQCSGQIAWVNAGE